MFDGSELGLSENIAKSSELLKRCAASELILEVEIGVVGGDSDPVTTSFMFAYENGAKSIDPTIAVERKTLGGAWDDQAKGKQAAEQLYDAGSDVVFQVAAAAGLGVLQAAKDRNLYAIGVDANQNDLQPGHVIASDIKNVGATIEKIFDSRIEVEVDLLSDLLIVIGHWGSSIGEFTTPDNGVVFNPDGSIHRRILVPPRITRTDLQNVLSPDSTRVLVPEGLTLVHRKPEGIELWLSYLDGDWHEIRMYDPKTGEWGETKGQYRAV